MDDDFEPILSDENRTVDDKLRDRLMQELEVIKADINACNDCWEVAVLRIQKSQAQSQAQVNAIKGKTSQPCLLVALVNLWSCEVIVFHCFALFRSF